MSALPVPLVPSPLPTHPLPPHKRGDGLAVDTEKDLKDTEKDLNHNDNDIYMHMINAMERRLLYIK